MEQQIQSGLAEYESEANRYVLKCIRYTMVLLSIYWLLTILGVFILDKWNMSLVFLSCVFLGVLPHWICTAVDLNKPWIKYMLQLCMGLMILLVGMNLTYHAVYAFVMPLFLAVQYRDRKVLGLSCLIMFICLYISAMWGYYHGVCDLNMLFLSKGPADQYVDFATGTIKHLQVNPNPWLYVPLYWVLPRGLALGLFALVASHVVENSADAAAKTAAAVQQSEIDAATNLLNKNKYTGMVRDYYPKLHQVGVIFWDINHLKQVNDTYGHAEGDLLISSFAGCICAEQKPTHRTFRIGGDEFVTMLENPTPEELEQTVRQARERIDLHNKSARVPLSASVGCSWGPGEKVLSLIKQADEEMYRDKWKYLLQIDPEQAEENILHDRLFEAFATISGHVYVYICDMTTGLSRWSKNAVDYFDLPGEYLQDAGNMWAQYIHPEDRQAYLDDLNQLFSGKSRQHKCEYRAKNRQGEYVWLECRGTLVDDRARGVQFFTGLMIRLDDRTKYDPLTKMKTMLQLTDRDLTEQSGVAVLAGFDGFRKVVNSYGYDYSDSLLREFSQRLMDYCGSTRMPYRFNGDEFIVLSPEETIQGAMEMFTEIQALATRLGSPDRLVDLSLTAGAVLYPKSGHSRSELIRNLEHSLEQGKAGNRGGLTFFADEIVREHQMVQLVRESVWRAPGTRYRDFTLFFQPIVSSETHKIVSCEALLRNSQWADNGIGVGSAISWLEDSGEIVPVGSWVMEQVFRKAHLWQQEFPDLRISFNVSARQLALPGFVDSAIAAATEAEVDPTHLTVELTESSQVEDIHAMAQRLNQLQSFGFRIALDDFGVEYATLAFLKSLPVNYLKIDQLFVRDLTKAKAQTNRTIIDAITLLCQNLGVSVVAEGVENREALEILQNFPISLYQGYYFSRPLPEDAFLALLRQGKALPPE